MTRQMQPVLWTKGLLLTPQHLQVQDRFLEDNLEFRLTAHTFCPWGFRSLEIDRDTLEQGGLAIAATSGIMPDGLLFDVPGADPAPPPRPLPELWEDDLEALTFYLAIPERRPGGFNVSIDAANGATRYVADDILRRDEVTGTSEKPVQVGRKNLRLLSEGENHDGYSVLPFVRIVREPTGEFRADESFVPPVLDIASSEHLMVIARGLLEVVSAKSAALSGMRRERRRGLADFGASDVGHFWLLYTVNSHLPTLRHIVETRRGHPAELWEVLAALAGALTTFSTRVGPLDLPAYDHGNLGECFGAMDETLRLLLQTVVPASHVTLPLEEVGPSVYATAIDQDRYFGAKDMFLAIRADLKKEELLTKVEQLLKVGAEDRMDQLIRRALLGLEMRHTPSPPGDLPIKLDFQYFRLDRTGSDWDAIRQARNLAAYVPDDFPNPRLELVILLPEEE